MKTTRLAILVMTLAAAALFRNNPARADDQAAHNPAPSDKATADQAPAKTAPAPAKMTDQVPEAKTGGLLGPDFRIGAEVSPLSFPGLLGFGVEVKWMNLLGLSFDYGFLPKETISSISVKDHDWTIAAKVYPFMGSFFVGVGIGGVDFTGNHAVTINGTAVNLNMDLSSVVVVPEIGWRWAWDSGFFMGIDLGVQFALSTSPSLTSDAPATIQGTTTYINDQNDIQNTANTFAKKPFPHFSLLQVGWYF